MPRSVLFVPLVLLSVLALSCSVGTDPGDCTSLECLPVQYNLGLTLTVDMDRDFTDREVRYFAVFLKPGNDVGVYSGPKKDQIRLGAGSDLRLPSEIYVNTFRLPPLKDDVAPIYLDFARDTILAPPGSYNVWRVGGAEDLPAYTDSILTPPDPVRPVAPTPHDTVSIGRGMEIRLEGRITPETPVAIFLYQSGPGERYAEFSTSGLSAEPLTITSQELRDAGFLPGFVILRIAQQHVQLREITPEIRSRLSFSMEYDIEFQLED